jgi:hypothetical protein
VLIDGNPLQNLDLAADLDGNFLIPMKDGKVGKSTLSK